MRISARIGTLHPSITALIASSHPWTSRPFCTIGWVVFLQVGLVRCETFRFGVTLSPVKWAAIALILALQAYLVLVASERPATGDGKDASLTQLVPVGALQSRTPPA